MSALLLTALVAWQSAAGLSLYNLQADTSTSSEDEAISNIALLPHIGTPIFPYMPVAEAHPREPSPDHSFSNIPGHEFILDTSAPNRPASVEQTKKSSKKDLSSYLSDVEDQIDNGSEPAPSRPRYLAQTIQSACRHYTSDVGGSKSQEGRSVSDATLELIRYLCEEYTDATSGPNTSEEDVQDEAVEFTQRSRPDWQRTAALSLLDVNPVGSSSVEDEAISDHELVPHAHAGTLARPHPAHPGSSPRDPQPGNPFTYIPEQYLSNFLNHITPVKEPTAINYPNSKRQKTQSVCNKYFDDLGDSSRERSAGVAIELIRSLCEVLGDCSEDDPRSLRTCKGQSRCRVIEWATSLRSLLYGALRPARVASSRPSARPPPDPMSSKPVNGRRDWMVLNEEYPGIMKQYINQFGNSTFLI